MAVQVQLRDRTGDLLGFADYLAVDAVARVQAVGTWTATLHTTDLTAQLVHPTLGVDMAARIVDTSPCGVHPDGHLWISGPVAEARRVISADSDVIEVAGWSDDYWMTATLARPEPLTASPPYSTASHDVFTGAASQVCASIVDANLGPAAQAIYRVPGLTVPTPTAIGSIGTARVRWGTVASEVWNIAEVEQFNASIQDLEFRAWEPVDAGMDFSPQAGTVVSGEVVLAAPEANRAVVAGGGELTARIIREVRALDGWRARQVFVDQRQTVDPAELTQAGFAELERVRGRSGIVANVGGRARFGCDYQVGDRASASIGDVTVTDTIREVAASVDDTGTVEVAASVGAVTATRFRPVRRRDLRSSIVDVLTI